MYKITKYDSDGNVTDVEKVVTTDEILDNYGVNSDAYATYATGQSLTVTNESDKSMDDGESAKKRFTYLDEESLVVVAYLNDDNDAVDSVDVGNLSDINVAKDDIRDEDTSTVYVLNVDDHDEAAPVAKLILVINPDPNAGSQRPGYSNIDVNLSGTNVTVTWTGTTEPSIQNMVDAVENEIMATGYQYVNTTSGYNGGQLEYYFQPYNIINGITSFGPTYTFNTVAGVSHEITVTVGDTVMNVDSTDTLASIGLIGHVQVTDADGNVSYVDSANLATATVVDGASYVGGLAAIIGSNGTIYGTPGASAGDDASGALAGTAVASSSTAGAAIENVTFPATAGDTDDYTDNSGMKDNYFILTRDRGTFYIESGNTVSNVGTGDYVLVNDQMMTTTDAGTYAITADTTMVTNYMRLNPTTATLDNVAGLTYEWNTDDVYTDADGNMYAQIGETVSLTVNLNGFTAATGTSTNLDASQVGASVSPTVAAQGAVWGTNNSGATVAPASGTVDFNNGVSYTGTLMYTFTVDATTANNGMTVALS